MTHHLMSDIEQRCRDNNVKLTPKRRAVLSILNSAHGALSAYEIAQQCNTQLSLALPAMSVYRILDYLQSEGLAHKLLLANKFVICSHVCCDHKHQVPQFLICVSCNAVQEVGVSRNVVDELKQSASQVGFQMLSSQLEIQCVCPSCLDS